MRCLLAWMLAIPLAVGCGSSTKDDDDDDGEANGWDEGGGDPSDPFGGSSTGGSTVGGGTGGGSTGGSATGGGTGSGTSTGGEAGGDSGGGTTSADGIADDPFSPRDGRWVGSEFSFSKDECLMELSAGLTPDAEISSLLTLLEDGFALSIWGFEPSTFVLDGRTFTGSDEVVTDYSSGATISGAPVPPLDAIMTLTSELSGTFSSDESASVSWSTFGTCEGSECGALFETLGIAGETCASESTSVLNWEPLIDDDTGASDGGDDWEDDWSTGGGDDCRHPYNPIHETSWEKTFAATWIDGSATATEQGMGTGYTSTGVETYKTWDKLTSSSGEGWEGSVYHGCDNRDGTKLGIIEWNVQLTFAALPSGPTTALMMLSRPRIYLADPSKIGTGDSWEYSYTLSYVDTSSASSGAGGSVSIHIPVSGNYTDKGLVEIEVMGETMEAWKIESTYTMDLVSGIGFDVSSVDGLSWFTRAYPGTAEHYWVEDMGLVYEKHVDRETGSTILEKTLTNRVGL